MVVARTAAASGFFITTYNERLEVLERTIGGTMIYEIFLKQSAPSILGPAQG